MAAEFRNLLKPIQSIEAHLADIVQEQKNQTYALMGLLAIGEAMSGLKVVTANAKGSNLIIPTIP